jgi:VanZ family protein
MRRPRTAWLLAIAWAVTVLVFSSIPGGTLPPVPAWNADKLIHAAVYGVLAALLGNAWWASGRGAPVSAALAFVLAAGFGGIDEIYQQSTAGRISSLADLIADCVGAAIGASAAWGILRRRHRRRETRDASS